MAKLPDKAEHQRQFAALDFAARRAIVKSVNRGKPVENRRHAPLAIGVAMRQIRFWRWAWLVGPGIGLVQLIFAPPEVALTNAVLATAILFVMAWVLTRRAQRSIASNTSIMEGRIGPPPSRGRSGPASHSKSGADDADDETASDAEANRPRPPAPRGKKRRKR